jgi:hypothetical protein
MESAMSTSSADHGDRGERPGERPSIEELARRQGVRPIRSADDLVREGIWESDEQLDAFLVDLYALRHSDLSAS